MTRAVSGAAMLLAIAVILVAIAWATSPDPKYNPASFEEEPLVEGLADLDTAVTLTQFASDDGAIKTALVVGMSESELRAIDLVEMGAAGGADPFEALASVPTLPGSLAEAEADYPVLSLPYERLLPSASSGMRHIGSGTNFPEHAEEANSNAVFQFPKFGAATPARTQVSAPPGILLDYEVELCLRFDRDIASMADFDAARKGVFLCGDFTNRNALIELADPDNLDSGSGFSDAKSGAGHFPAARCW